MLRALWFLIQIAAVVLAAIWLLELPGEIELSAFGYSLTVQTGLFAIGFILSALLFGLAAKAVWAVIMFPRWLGGWGRKRRRARAIRQLTQGYALLAAGEADKALKLSRRAQEALPDIKAMALLLEAQSSRALGQDVSAVQAYRALMEDKDAAFLGLKGLLGQSISAGRTEQALEYAERAVKRHPKASWVVKTLYDLQIAVRDVDAARKTLKKAVKLRAIDKAQAVSDDVAMWMYQAERAEESGQSEEAVRLIEKAVKLDPAFAPAVAALGMAMVSKGKSRRAQSLFEQAWKVNPHPVLLPIWDRLAPANTSRDMTKRMRWYEKLVSINTESVHGQMAAAREAMESGLMNEARAYLVRAEKLGPSASLYRLFIKLERAAHADEETIRALEEKIYTAPPEPVWYCRKTGIVYDHWSPIARPHGAFNTITWGVPHLMPAMSVSLDRQDIDDPMMIGAL